MRAERALDRPRDLGARAPRSGRERVGCAVGTPVVDEVRRIRVDLLDRLLPAGLPQRRRGDEDAGAGRRRRPTRARTGSAPRSRIPRRPLAARAPGTPASARSARAGRARASPPRAPPPASGASPKRSRSRSTRLTWACASGVSSQMHRAAAPMPGRGLDDVAPSRPA